MKITSKAHIAKMMKTAIDSYPGGLCFSTPKGTPILVNMLMTNLIYTLTSHTLMECNATWEEMKAGHTNCKQLLPNEIFRIQKESERENLFFEFPDNSIWQFQRIMLTEANAIQLIANNVTNLYLISIELYKNNEQLKDMHARKRALLENIVEINHNKELLNAKMRIHDDLGECLLRAQKAIIEHTIDDEHSEIAQMWLHILHNINGIKTDDTKDESKEELLKVANMIGCQITFKGDQIKHKAILQLVYAAIREALMNAVLHAQADELIVEMKEAEDDYQIRIYDNGKKDVQEIREGVGLTGLRARLEEEGANMKIQYDSGIVLVLDIPKGCEEI